MKRRILWVGVSILLLAVVAVWVLFPIRSHRQQEVSTASNDIDAIIALFPSEEQDQTRTFYEAEMQKAKETGNAGFVARYEESLKELLIEMADEEPLPDDYREAAAQYEAEIQREKEAGADEDYIAIIESFRDTYLNLARKDEERKRKRLAKRARRDALSTPEEHLAYYEAELLEDQDRLRRATEEGNASSLKMAHSRLETTQTLIKYYKGKIAWRAKKPEVDALLERIERYKDEHRHLLHIEVVDGVEKVVGVRTPDEIASSSSEKAEGRDFPMETPTPFPVETPPSPPVLPDDVSSSSLVVESTPIPSLEGALESVVKAQTQFNSWRKTIDTDYLDVLVSQYMTPQELNQYFPTQADRALLQSRSTDMRKAVVSKIRNVVNGIQGATIVQKRELARKLTTSNFDSEFAESVLKQLTFDDK